MRFERSRIAVARKTRRFDRALRVHAEDINVQKNLQHRLRLHVAARRAERHQDFALSERERWTGREPRALARRDRTRMAGIGPRLGAASRAQYPYSGNDGRVVRTIR